MGFFDQFKDDRPKQWEPEIMRLIEANSMLAKQTAAYTEMESTKTEVILIKFKEFDARLKLIECALEAMRP